MQFSACQKRATVWSQPTDWETVYRRASGRPSYNSLRHLRALIWRKRLVDLVIQWGEPLGRHGPQARLAAELESTGARFAGIWPRCWRKRTRAGSVSAVAITSPYGRIFRRQKNQKKRKEVLKTVTNPHETSQADAASRLSIEQQNAIDLLIQGKPDREVAAAVGVARETVTRWRHGNPYFAAELNRQRKALWGSAHERLRGLVHRAVDILEKALEEGDLKAAVEVLKVCKVYGTVQPPSGPEDPELVLWQEAEAWAVRELAKRGPADDPMMRLVDLTGEAKANLARQRMVELRQRLGISQPVE